MSLFWTKHSSLLLLSSHDMDSLYVQVFLRGQRELTFSEICFNMLLYFQLWLFFLVIWTHWYLVEGLLDFCHTLFHRPYSLIKGQYNIFDDLLTKCQCKCNLKICNVEYDLQNAHQPGQNRTYMLTTFKNNFLNTLPDTCSRSLCLSFSPFKHGWFLIVTLL